jgi:hypothetical protein
MTGFFHFSVFGVKIQFDKILLTVKIILYAKNKKTMLEIMPRRSAAGLSPKIIPAGSNAPLEFLTRFTLVPSHGSEDIGRGLLRQILREIEITPEEFLKHL